MKKLGIIYLSAMFMVACNNSGSESTTTDSSINTNANSTITDTGLAAV